MSLDLQQYCFRAVQGAYLLTVLASSSFAQCEGAKLNSPSPDLRTYGGMGVSLEAGRVLFGVPRETSLQANVGSSYYVFCDESGAGPPVPVSPTELEGEDYYGASVSISAGWAAMSAPNDDGGGVNSGAAYVFRDELGQWVLECQLAASDAGQGARFGRSLSLEGNTLLVGASGNQANGSAAGKAYIFEYDNGDWMETDILLPGDIDGGWWFGASVDLSGKVAVIGAPNRAGCVFASGAGYVFEKVDGSWVETARLCGLDAAFADKVGCSIAVSGETVLLGAPHHAAVGSFAGAVYVFEKIGGGWVQSDKLLPPENPAIGITFGRSVALEGDLAVIGAEYGDGNEPDSGTAYVFERRPSGWTFTRKLQAPDGAAFDLFGISVDLSSGAAIVGAAGDDHSGFEDAGSAWLYDVGLGDTYCAVEPNSTGAPALISAVGTASVTDNELVLAATPLPKQAGLFFLGATQLELPFGNGWRCAGGQVVRLAPRLPAAGILREQLDFTSPPLTGLIVVGSRWNFQAWYRDPMAGGAFFNTSNALSVLFEP